MSFVRGCVPLKSLPCGSNATSILLTGVVTSNQLRSKRPTWPPLTCGKFEAALFLSPLAEQRRIVAKVDELMALVDALETQLTTARNAATKLLEAAVVELTAPTHSSPKAERSEVVRSLDLRSSDQAAEIQRHKWVRHVS